MRFVPSKTVPHFFFLSCVTLLIASGGGTNSWSQMFLLLLTGVGLILFPIRKLPGPWIVALIASMFLWMAFSTWAQVPWKSPAQWMSEIHPDFSQVDSISVQQSLSLEKILFFATAVCWLFLVIQNPLSHRHRIKALRWFVIFIGALALVTAFGIITKVQHPFTWGTHKFSFFPNHNQSGSVFVLGCIVVVGFIIRELRKRDWSVILYLGLFSVIFFALVMGMSRSAILLSVAGASIYLVLSLEKRNYRFYLKIGVPFCLLLLALFILYGGSLLDEFIVLLGKGGTTEELRLMVWADATKMITEFPLTGVGLGNFRYYFPFFIDLVPNAQAVHHPESDLLWVWIELGLVGVFILVFGLGLLGLRLNPSEALRTKSTRLAAMVALSMFLFSCLIEVSGHRLGTSILAIVLYGIIQPGDAKLTKIPGLSVLSRLCGVAVLILAGFWIMKTVQSVPVTGDEVIAFAKQSPAEIYTLQGEEATDVEKVDQEIDDLLLRFPLMEELYDIKGVLGVSTNKLERTKDAFHKHHLLQPHRWKTFVNHGLYVHQKDFELALEYWALAIEVAGSEKYLAFESIARRLQAKYYKQLRVLSYEDMRLRFMFFSLLRGNPTAFSEEVNLELGIDGELSGYSTEQKQAILWRFAEINGPQMLKYLLSRYPVLGSENWTIRAQYQSGFGDFKEASRLAIMNYPEPEMIDLASTSSLRAIRNEYILDSKDPLRIIALIQKHLQNQNFHDALKIAEVADKQLVKSEYLQYQLAFLLFQKGDYETSWKVWRELIDQSLNWDAK